MGFSFRKLYPNAQQRGCCGVQCPCPPTCTPTTIIIERCECPLEIVTTPCSGNPPTCGGERCTGIGYWNGNVIDLELCTVTPSEACSCDTITVTTCTTWECTENPPKYPECCPDFGCFYFPYTHDNGNVPTTRQIFNECVVSGAVPHTYKFENVGGYTAGFPCARQRSSGNPRTYERFSLDGYPSAGAIGVTAWCGDPAFTVAKDKQRFYKTPLYPNGVANGATASYAPYCIKLHSTPSQEVGIENRTMVISGRNVYRYTGHFSGDPYLGPADPFWDTPGGSGIKQLEETIDDTGLGNLRQFPLNDSFLQLPLWGQESNDNFNITLPDPCAPVYTEECNDPSGIPICWGCHCLRTGPATTSEGHFLPNDPFNVGSGTQGYTAGYFSFSSFNPESYLDSYTIDGPIQTIQLAGPDNALGFGNAGPLYSGEGGGFNCDPGNVNCLGCSGATSHGMRLGVPTCSVWSLVKALYSRVFYAATKNETSNIVHADEATFRSNFSRFSSAIDTMLADDPSGTINETSKVQYHLAKVAEALELDSKLIFTGVSLFRFTFPNVFLWNIPRYNNVSGPEKWKHLIVLGNGNIVYDSRSVAVDTPYTQYYNSALLHDDVNAQNYLSSVFYLNDVNHQKWRITQGSRHARMVIFPGSGGPTTVFNNPSTYRRAAQAKVSLIEMPICASMTAADNSSFVFPLSLCSICNALPDAVCRPDGDFTSWITNGSGVNTVTDDPCSPVDMFTDPDVEYLTCGQIGGRLVEENSMTASYQI